MTTTMKLGELFDGCRLGDLQSAGLMQVIPILADRTPEDRFANPGEAIVGTSGYGSVVVRNPSARILIVPMNAAYMSKHGSQDHAVTSAGVIEREKATTFNNSLCIESTQGGTMPPDAYRLSILPASLRADAANTAGRQVQYSALWNNIEQFNQEMGSGHRGHLRDFFERFEQELDEFIAQFEPVPRQIGAIVLIGGEIVGIERTPSQTYWLGVWEALIRDCYGSRAMQTAKRVREVPETRARLGEVTSLDELELEILHAERREQLGVEQMFEQLKNEDLEVSQPYTHKVHGTMDVKVVKNPHIFGEVVTESDGVIYASMVAAGRS